MSSSKAPRSSGSSNRRAGYCDRCGAWISAGAGTLYRCMGEASGCEKHFDDEEGGWHLACSDRTACDQQAKQAREARKVEVDLALQAEKAKRDAAAEATATAASVRAGMLAAGWERATVAVPSGEMVRVAVLAQVPGFYYTQLEEVRIDGQRYVIETANGYDDSRCYVWAPRDQARALRAAWITKSGITREQALEWLEKYAGCEGDDIWRQAAE